jgi:hypothetical protein
MDGLILPQPLHGGDIGLEGSEVPWADFFGGERGTATREGEKKQSEFHEGESEWSNG